MRDAKTYDLFTAQAANGVSNVLYVRDFRHLTISYGTASNANFTVNVVVGIGDTAPTFSSAASSSNQYAEGDYALSDAAGVITDGDTGIVFSGTDGTGVISVNTDGVDWVALKLSSYSAGNITATATVYEG